MYKNKRILVVVPARGGSKGIKLKNIQPVNGVPLVALVGKVVKHLDYVDRAIVSTDHSEIAKIAVESGLDCPFMRTEALSQDIVSDLDVLTHAINEIEKIDNVKYDVILMLQPTSPMRKPDHVTTTLKKLIDGNYDAVWTVSETDSKGHPLKQLIIKNDKLLYYDNKGKKIIARQQLKPVYHRNGVAYALTRECILKKKTIYTNNSSAVVIDDILVNIDTKFDLMLADFILKNNIMK